jgi:hypothetical protein
MKVSPLARLYYEDQVRTFVRCLRHEAAHALRKELNGPNAAARVAAARTLLGDAWHHRRRRRRPRSQAL